MPEYCVDRSMAILNRHKKALNGSKVLVLGVAYKNDIDDYRESPAIDVIEKLIEAGAETEFFDPYIPTFREHGKEYKGIEKIDEDIISEYDLVVITAAHSVFDYEMIQKNAKAIFDTRNAMKDINDRHNIEVL